MDIIFLSKYSKEDRRGEKGAQYINYNSNLLAPIVYFADLV